MNHTHVTRYTTPSGSSSGSQSIVASGDFDIEATIPANAALWEAYSGGCLNIRLGTDATGQPLAGITSLVVQCSIPCSVIFYNGDTTEVIFSCPAGENVIVGLTTSEVGAALTGVSPLVSINVVNSSNPLVAGTLKIKGKFDASP
jgi:hypothetical protein